MQSNDAFFSSLLPELSTRAARAAITRLGFSNPALRAYLAGLFLQKFGEKGAFLGDPVFEATFGWQAASQKMDDLAPALLTKALVDAMDAPGGSKGGDYRFPRDIAPYQHQLETWELLSQVTPQSVVVTSGTGSGKTECFMVPILDQMVRELQARGSKLVGVRALFLYPLNALIASQQERLHAWTSGFGEGIRFCLYNGLTPNKEPQHKRNLRPNEVIDREVLRAAPPPLLVTNATMLEYMLVRAQDAPILEASQGQLQWIVLDEAHTYIGSQAAELALLLRRVLHAFGVNSDQVRFVATSATIGGEDAAIKLRDFLASLAGVSVDRVHVVAGRRRIPALPTGESRHAKSPLDDLLAIPAQDSEQRYLALADNAQALRIRQLFVPPEGTPAKRLTDIEAAIGDGTGDHMGSLRWLDLLTSARDAKGTPFLPLRLHAFHNVISGLWACCDSGCSHRTGTPLDAPEWPYGAVYLDERRHCDCGAPVFEMRSCDDCNTTYLWARRVLKGDGRYYLGHAQEEVIDDFSLEVEQGEEELQDDLTLDQQPILIANDFPGATTEILLERTTLVLDPKETNNTVRLRAREETCGETSRGIECPSCQSMYGKSLFRPAMLGAPFLLAVIVPTLLEYCPDIASKEGKPKDRPYRGRRMITFSDSRQGTARMAVKLQQDSERNRVRALIYRRAFTKGAALASEEAGKVEAEIAALRPAMAHSPAIAAMVKEREERLAELARPKPLSFDEMADWLATSEPDIYDRIAKYYADMDRQFQGRAGALELAKMLIVREFARRPKRLNSLESMGLVAVHYPKLDAINALPSGLGSASSYFSLTEWKAFLKLCLDFHVRANTYIKLPDTWQKWGGNRFPSRQLLPYGSDEVPTRRLRPWPQVARKGKQPRLVRLLGAAFTLDPGTEYGRDVIDSILKAAWDDLARVDLLQLSGDGRLLDLKDIALAPLDAGWMCPVTRRVLDVTLKGLTPYFPTTATIAEPFKCKPVVLPRCELISRDFASEDLRVAAIRGWLNASPEVAALRSEGLWSDLNDRVVEGSFYFRAVEHSAQQSGARLKDYEAQFKQGWINLMSCSTTMEMGVDIGGISVVAMNNVPPHPANYLQRAGRAGRRAEARSIALTVCKNNPHDQFVFRNTLWAFTTRLPAPVINLSSQSIVQRHANSMLLASFLRKHMAAAGDLNRLDMGWWMLPLNSSVSERFIAWARCFDERAEPELARGLRFLLRRTCLEGIASLQRVAADAAQQLEEHRSKWLSEFQAIQEQLARFSGPHADQEPAYRALRIQESRLTGEYVLRELASEGFLPGYGFPTDIASLETLTLDEIDRVKAALRQDERIDNLLRRRELPSRDSATALREYAPGAEVVIDGLVYRSAGITLNWHAPASVQEIKEIQNIREAWRCRACGSSGSTLTSVSISLCPDCGAAFAADDESGRHDPVRFQFLEPAGFSVDLFEAAHNDVSTPTYIPVEAPWINAYGEWLPLANPALGAFRSSPLGTVLHFSSGVSRLGYAVCLSCGRAEAMNSAGVLPHPFYDFERNTLKEHKRLRGGQGRKDAICEGSHQPFAVKPDLRLGHESRTDVFEVFLRGADGAGIQDKVTAFSIAVALRSAVAAELGIEVSELGCDIKPVRQDRALTGQALVIYDHGASGYASSVSRFIPQALRRARAILACPAGCDSACQSCLLHFDTRFRVDDLDRHAAMQLLTEQWLEKLELPEDQSFFGKAASVAEHRSLPEAITQALAMPGARELRLFLGGDPADWDLAGSPLRRWVQAWSVSSGDLRLVVPAGAESCISPSDRFILNLFSNLHGVSVWSGKPASVLHHGVLAAELVASSGVTGWASTDVAIARADQGWGASGALLVRGANLPEPSPLLKELGFEVEAPVEAQGAVRKLEVASQLDGSVAKFGAKLLAMLEEALGSALVDKGDEIEVIRYQDRYMNAPLPCSLLLELISSLKSAYPDQWAVSKVQLTLALLPDPTAHGRSPNLVSHNWMADRHRQEALESAFEYCGLEAEVRCGAKRDSIHARVLGIQMRSGRGVRVWFDQGFSYWRAGASQAGRGSVSSSFPFHAGPEAQGVALAESKASIEGQNYPTYLFIERT